MTPPGTSSVAGHPPDVTRFAPSPTGYLHLGHAYSALAAWRWAQRSSGRFILRIEDIDEGRCRARFVDAIYEDLAWLGIDWPLPVRKQSEHLEDYAAALAGLNNMGLLYPCFCTRKDISDEIAGAGRAPHLRDHGPDGPIYPGRCRRLRTDQRRDRIASGVPYAWRLDVSRANALVGPLAWRDRARGDHRARAEIFGDVVLARKDIATSYHLAVTVDDALQGVSVVVRGEDLLPATHIHRLLQALLGLPVPEWLHHPLVTDAAGRRLAKRDQSITIRALRAAGLSPGEVIARAQAMAPALADV